MSDYQLVASGRFTSDGSAKDIPLRSDFDFFEAVNYTQSATTQTTGRGVRFEWRKGFADNAALMFTKQNSSNALDLEVITSGGFQRIDQGNESVGAAVTISGITAANPPVITTSAAHGLSVGDRIRVYGTTGMLQLAGLEATVTAVGSTTTASLGYIDASGFAAAATAGSLRKLPENPLFNPERLLISNVTQASSAVVTFTVTHNLAVGAKLRFYVPSAESGMIELDDVLGEVTAVSVANNTATVDVDSSAFTAFAFPTSAQAAAGWTPPHAVPVGEIPSINSEAMDNQAEILMRLAAGVDSPAGSTSDVIYWRAWKAGFLNQE